jgi:hypothetical protein
MIIHHIKEENDILVLILILFIINTGHVAYVTNVKATCFFDSFLSRKSNYVVKTGVSCSLSNGYFVVVVLSASIELNQQGYNVM